MPGTQPLPRAEDDDEIVRRPAAAIALRWLLVAADAVADQAHLAVMLGHACSLDSKYIGLAESVLLSQRPMLPHEEPKVPSRPPHRATLGDEWVSCEQQPALHFLNEQRVPDFYSGIHFSEKSSSGLIRPSSRAKSSRAY